MANGKQNKPSWHVNSQGLQTLKNLIKHIQIIICITKVYLMFTLICMDITKKAFEENKADIGVWRFVALSICVLMDLMLVRALYNIW